MQLTLAATSKQIMVSYTASDTGVCTVEVSESPTYSPVVTDVNATLFAGANQDSRAGSLGAGTTGRTFLVGTAPDMRGVVSNLASDTKRYGRLLQPGTTHYVRVTCGATVATGSITTKNRPLGMTRSFERPMASAGVYAYPSLDDTNRNQVLSDPSTGVQIRKLTCPTEDTTGGQILTPGSGAPWPFAQTTINDNGGVPGYISAWPTEGGSSRLYFVTDSVSRFLGSPFLQGGSLAGFNSSMFFSASNPHFGTNPTQLFYLAIDGTDGNGNAQVVKCQLPPSGDAVYGSSAASGAHAPCTFTNLTASNNITAQLVAFDPTFDPTKFNIGSNQVVQGNHLLFTALRGNQDSYGWVGAIDLTTTPATVVAFAPLWKRGGSGALSFRWCAIHTGHPALGASQMSFTAKTMYQTGVGLGPYTTTLSGAMNDTQMTITFASNTPTAPFADTTLYPIAAGDEVQLTGEVMYLGSFVSGTTWNIAARGVAGGGAAKAHSNGETVLMGCRCHNPNDFSQVGPSWWNFLADPHATDTTGTNLITQLGNATIYSGHEGFANGRGIAETGYAAFIGPAMTNNPAFIISDSPDFAGVNKTAAGNSWQKHDAPPQQSNASSAQANDWGLDSVALDTDPQLQATSLTNVTGTLWKFVNTNYALKRKQLAMLALVGSHPLLDISSTATGDVIGGLAADNYKYCVANAVNECRTGSAVSDIYFNAPDVTGGATCYGAMAWGDTTKVCLGHIPAIGDTVVQIGIEEANSTGKWFRALSDGLMPPKIMNTNSDSHATPDGKWATVFNYAPSGNFSILLAKAPPWPGYDGINRNTFIQKSVSLLGPAATVTALTEFGYDTNLYCTSRNEVCVSAQSNNPYFFASESYTRIACAGGSCTNSIPVIPDRTVYYRHKFYDSGGNLINTSGIFLLAEDSAPVVGGGPLVSVSGNVVISGPVILGAQ